MGVCKLQVWPATLLMMSTRLGVLTLDADSFCARKNAAIANCVLRIGCVTLMSKVA
jgi:hypothetical protein